jgi:hypothetical protein
MLRRLSVCATAAVALAVLVAACGPRAVSRVAGLVHPGCRFDVNLAAKRPALVALTIDDTPDAA